MESRELYALIAQLLPGFLAVWVVYGLTARRKGNTFERVVEALIFTVIVQVLTSIAHELLEWFGTYVSLGRWTENVALGWSLVLAILVGVLFARYTNSGNFPKWLTRCGGSKRTTFASEWYSAFHRQPRWVVLHLSGQRRLYGFPEEWPDQPEEGHFIIMYPEWLLDTGERAPLYGVARFVVSVKEVEMVELLYNAGEITAPPPEVEGARRQLLDLHRKETENGHETTAIASTGAA